MKFLHWKNILKKITPLLFSHLPLKCSRLAIIQLQLLFQISFMIFFTRSYHSYNLHTRSNFVVPDLRTVHQDQNSIYTVLPSPYLKQTILKFQTYSKPKFENGSSSCRFWKKYIAFCSDFSSLLVFIIVILVIF